MEQARLCLSKGFGSGLVGNGWRVRQARECRTELDSGACGLHRRETAIPSSAGRLGFCLGLVPTGDELILQRCLREVKVG